MSVFFVRHGQTDWNAQHKLMGAADIELNESGRKQASQTRDKLKDMKFSAIYASPQKRATETARIIAEFHKDTPLIFSDNLRERDFGQYEGAVNDGNYFGLWQISTPEADGTETIRQLEDRIFSFLEQIEKKHRDEDILLVGHGGSGTIIETYFNGQPDDGDLLKYVAQNGELKKYEMKLKEEK
ncbi:MAG: histidine phosphatase family protein [Candidatus Nomurabacteria bacterium]|jgi:broad specificity phosphatase PhoE|nr:histidine phosphatase family protein [Candidatus Nomurabacteria bacterium]